MPGTADGGDSSTNMAVGVSVVGDDLQAATAVLDGDILAVGNFEIEGQCGGRINTT